MNNPLVIKHRTARFLCKITLFCCIFAPTLPVQAQDIQPAPPSNKPASIQMLTTGPRTSIRGLSAVNDKIVWVSGSAGTVGRSIDSGKTWTWIVVPGYEKRDFRDIEAFDANTAIIMAIAEPANILKTTDGGKTWKLVYENTTKGMFMDAMEFWNHDSGIIVGDPIEGRFFITRTFDGGNTWHDIPLIERPQADSTEGCFATSGTNIRPLSLKEACFVSGGPKRSRLFIRDKAIDLPLLNGATSTGANSVAVKNDHTLIVTGGDFAKDTVTDRNCFLTLDAGLTWIRPTTPPHGYRGCVEYIGDKTVLCCGTSGVDISTDDGMNWNLISSLSFHVCRKAKKGKTVFLAGSGGRIAKLIY